MKIFILGCGALGSNIAMNLAFDLKDHELILVDFDKVEARNYQFGTQQYLREQDGQKKVEALQLNIYKIAGNKNVDYRDNKVQQWGFYFVEKGDLIIDCLDNYSAREYVRLTCRDMELDCIHIGFSPSMTFEVGWNDKGYKTQEDILGSFDLCEAEGARSFIQYVAGLATNCIIDFIKNQNKVELVGNKFGITKIQ
ncbi:MAG: ThiF family adenylyltransferase [Methanogenium sp.]|jgi:hypothetical protein